MLSLPYWLIRLLPMWQHICPKCRRIIKVNSHKCAHCGNKFRGLAIKIPPVFFHSYEALGKFVHKYVFPRVSSKIRDFLTKYFTIFFADNFASGTTSAWDITEAGFTVVTLHPFQGNYCGQSIAPASSFARVFKNGTLPLSPIMYHRAYYYFDPSAMPTSGSFNEIVFCGTYDSTTGSSGNAVRAALQGDGAGNVFWTLDYDINSVETIVNENTASNPSSGVWTCVEIVRDLTNQIAELWANNIQKVLVTGLSQVNNSDSIFDGIEFNGNSSSATVWVADVVASDRYNGPIPTNVPMTYGDGLTSYTC